MLIADLKQLEITAPNELNIQDVLSAILYKGTITEFTESDYFKNLEKGILPIIFKDKLAVIPFEQQHQLMFDAAFDVGAYGLAEFKGKAYFLAKFSDEVVYNTIQLNQAERASRQTESAIKQLKSLFQKTGKIKNIEGIKLVTEIYSRDFVRERYGSPHKESFEMYVSFELLEKFLGAEITNQDLIDASIILVDGDRIKVNLTNFS